MVYVDDAIWHWQGLKWCHLLADDVDELHRFAWQLGILRASYQGPPKTSAPHYDLTGYERSRALMLGARACSRQEIAQVFRVVRVPGGKVVGGDRAGGDKPKTATKTATKTANA